MKKIIVTLLLLVNTAVYSNIKAERLSAAAEFSLITVSPGEELYSSFGHSALLLEDTASGLFKIYNYGTFDFDTPNFYWTFLRGLLKYKLNVENPMELLYVARSENRFMTQQILNLSADQSQKLYDFLETNFLPENRFYKYDFFYDNCSTRIRDALISICGDALDFHLVELENKRSFRQIIDPYLENKRYEDLGMDMGMGYPADFRPSHFQTMFFPDSLMMIFSRATLLKNGETIPLVASRTIVLSNNPVQQGYSVLYKPWFALLLLLLLTIAITAYHIKKDKNGFWVDAVLFSLSGLIGLILLFLWAGTDHYVSVKNYNMIWAVPLHLIAVPMLLLGKKMKKISSYFLVNFFVLFFLLVFWAFVPQELNENLIPLIIAMAIRSMHIYYRIDKNIVRWNV